MKVNDGSPVPVPGRSVLRLTPARAMQLLAGVGYGRIVFTRNALPAIRPVNHLVDGDDVIIRTRLAGQLGREASRPGISRTSGIVVAYEADDIDPILHVGWSVVVTGMARQVTDPERIAYYDHVLMPWVDQPMDAVIAIEPSIVSGIQLMPYNQSLEGME